MIIAPYLYTVELGSPPVETPSGVSDMTYAVHQAVHSNTGSLAQR